MKLKGSCHCQSVQVAPVKTYMMLDFAADWCEIPNNKRDTFCKRYPSLSIEDWHKKHMLRVK